jgi:hypothetical protein
MKAKALFACALLAVLALAPLSLAEDRAVLQPRNVDTFWDRGGAGGWSYGAVFDWKIAGSWMGQGSFDVDLGCDGSFEIFGIPVSDVHTYGLGGVVLTTNPANPNTGQGTWMRTGPRQITGRNLGYASTLVASVPDATELPADVTVMVSMGNIAVIGFVVEFDSGFQTATSTFAAKVYTPDQDPLDPTEQPIVCSQGQHTNFRKISATE